MPEGCEECGLGCTIVVLLEVDAALAMETGEIVAIGIDRGGGTAVMVGVVAIAVVEASPGTEGVTCNGSLSGSMWGSESGESERGLAVKA